MNRPRTGLLLALVTLLALTAAPAGAQDYPPEAATCQVTVVTPVPGQTITVNCNGWMPNGEVEVLLLSEPQLLEVIQTDADGELTEPVTIPSDVPPGDHTLRLSGRNAVDEPQTFDIALTVEAPEGADGADGGGPGLAATGAGSWPGVLLGVGLLAAGGAAVYAARRRQAKQQA